MPSLAEALAERLLHRLPPDRAYDRAALQDATTGEAALPRTVRHFIDRMMTRRVEIERERLRILRQPWLDHEHEEVRRAEEALLAAVHRHVRIPAAAWERVLRHASQRVAAYLVQPVPTLEDFIFGSDAPGPSAGAPQQAAPEAEKQASLPAEVVLRRLSYFAAYPYLREATSAYVEQREVPSFPRRRLIAFLRRVDEKMCDSHDPEDWLRLLQPLFALAEVAYPDHDGLPVALLESFFEEKKADTPLQRLRAARRKHDLDTLSPSALGEVIAPPASRETRAPQEATQKEERPPSQDDVSAARSTRPEATPPAAPASTSSSLGEGRSEPRDSEPREEHTAATRAEEATRTPPQDEASPAREAPASTEEREATEAEATNGEPAERTAATEEELSSGELSSGEPSSDPRPLWKRFLGFSEPDESASAGAEDSATPTGKEPLEENGETGPSEGARPRWQQFSVVSSDEATSEPPPPAPSPSPRPNETPAPAEENAPSAERPSAERPSAENDEPSRDLRPLEEEVLGHAADNRELFVRELFGGSRAEYERILRRLRDAANWRAATQIIAGDVFRAHRVNIYSDPARSFTDAAETSFR